MLRALPIQLKYACPPFWSACTLYALYKRSLPFQQRYPLKDEISSNFRQPLFIISAGRSGTTLLRSMLVAGGQIAIPQETAHIHSLAVKYSALQHLNWEDLSALMIAYFENHHLFNQWETNLAAAYHTVRNLPEEERSLARTISEVYMTYGVQHFPKAVMWGDQSPRHTFYLPWILRVFPQAKFVHLLRDGRDVISSMVERHGSDYLEHGTFRWQTSIRRVAALKKRVISDQFLEIRYEHLVSDPENTLQKISQFIDIEYSLRMLEYWNLSSTVEHKVFAYHRNIGKPVSTNSIGRWRERLTNDQQHYVMTKIAEQLNNLGYF